MPAPALLTPRQFLRLTIGLLAACLLLIPFFDQPLALFLHQHCAPARPFFEALTSRADQLHELSMAHLLGIPVVFLGLALAFGVGRWVLRSPAAGLFLVLLLTHELSMVAARVLKGVLLRLRPVALFAGAYHDLGFGYDTPNTGSFPSTHTAIYASLFVPLAVAFPQRRLPLLLFPVLIGLGRLVLDMHYLSDVLFSGWLVVLFTFLAGQLTQLPAIAGPQAALVPVPVPVGEE
ncbi:phosphatase PAP2 family protein [Hymenobacter chitinivorans]|uniref:PAP2 superfamily protein n=1 Tax=Hymenobacter chitinivorans DSM 11115 TaxID=1121954 RepID=A0A2M9BMM0_9BACT|nr:phosphatase PAP2 family protein [Hymenobacter chitinivorans]PJJ59175.1 PAP2 superfamily protein [Hymenobacter chitinivorans DSM 11115]